MSTKLCLCIGAMFGAAGVSLGALGAHALESHLEQSLGTLHEQSLEYVEALKSIEKKLEQWETATRYLMFHALALLAVGLTKDRNERSALTVSAWTFIGGMLMFSGGLYAYVLTEVKTLVHIVPIGGVMLIVGWVTLAVGLCGSKREPEAKN